MGALARTRLMACAAAVLTVAAGLGIRGVAADEAAGSAAGETAKYAGDALYTVLILALVVLIAPRMRPLAAASAALAFSCAVELLQLTPIPAELSARSLLARLVLGSTFHAPDLLCYVAGATVAGLVHRGLSSPRCTAPSPLS